MSAGRAGRTPVDYDAHLGSAGWRDSAARKAELQLAGHRCRVCDRGPPNVRLDVHHRNYDRFGRERVEDLTTLCRECHVVVTDALRRRRNATAGLPPRVDTPRVVPDRSFGEQQPGSAACPTNFASR